MMAFFSVRTVITGLGDPFFESIAERFQFSFFYQLAVQKIDRTPPPDRANK